MATTKNTTTKSKTAAKSTTKSTSKSTTKSTTKPAAVKEEKPVEVVFEPAVNLGIETTEQFEVAEESKAEEPKVIERSNTVKAPIARPDVKTYDAHEGIPCESITFGLLGMIGLKSGFNYEWLNDGDVVEVEYQDLIAAINRGNSYVMKPRFVIRNDDIVNKYPKVKEVYAGLYNIEEMRDALYTATIPQLKRIVNNLPAGAKDTMAKLAKNEVAEGKFDSLSKMKALDEVLGTNQVQLIGLIG